MELKSESGKIAWNGALLEKAAELSGLKEARATAFARFQDAGFPDTKNEFWRYTSTATLAATEYQYANPSVKADAKLIGELQRRLEKWKGAAHAVFIDGWFAPQFSNLKPLGDGVSFANMRDLALNRPASVEMGQDSNALTAMNQGLFQDGFWLHVREKIAQPLLILYLQTTALENTTAQIMNRVAVESHAAIQIVECYDSVSNQPCFDNHGLNIELAEAGAVEHIRIQQSGSKTWLRTAAEVSFAPRSIYRRFDFEAGGSVARNEIHARLNGAGASCILSGAVIGNGTQHFDQQIVMEHIVPETSSDQSYRSLLAGAAHGVFGGRVRVYHNAQKTDARQVHKTLLLSKEAQADTKPQLEIDADDVKCSHGAAIGQLDEDSVFYLRSRGISRKNAEEMLAAGFVVSLLDSISNPDIREFVKAQMESKLSGILA